MHSYLGTIGSALTLLVPCWLLRCGCLTLRVRKSVSSNALGKDDYARSRASDDGVILLLTSATSALLVLLCLPLLFAPHLTLSLSAALVAHRPLTVDVMLSREATAGLLADRIQERCYADASACCQRVLSRKQLPADRGARGRRMGRRMGGDEGNAGGMGAWLSGAASAADAAKDSAKESAAGWLRSADSAADSTKESAKDWLRSADSAADSTKDWLGTVRTRVVAPFSGDKDDEDVDMEVTAAEEEAVQVEEAAAVKHVVAVDEVVAVGGAVAMEECTWQVCEVTARGALDAPIAPRCSPPRVSGGRVIHRSDGSTTYSCVDPNLPSLPLCEARPPREVVAGWLERISAIDPWPTGYVAAFTLALLIVLVISTRRLVAMIAEWCGCLPAQPPEARGGVDLGTWEQTAREPYEDIALVHDGWFRLPEDGRSSADAIASAAAAAAMASLPPNHVSPPREVLSAAAVAALRSLPRTQHSPSREDAIAAAAAAATAAACAVASANKLLQPDAPVTSDLEEFRPPAVRPPESPIVSPHFASPRQYEPLLPDLREQRLPIRARAAPTPASAPAAPAVGRQQTPPLYVDGSGDSHRGVSWVTLEPGAMTWGAGRDAVARPGPRSRGRSNGRSAEGDGAMPVRLLSFEAAPPPAGDYAPAEYWDAKALAVGRSRRAGSPSSGNSGSAGSLSARGGRPGGARTAVVARNLTMH